MVLLWCLVIVFDWNRNVQKTCYRVNNENSPIFWFLWSRITGLWLIRRLCAACRVCFMDFVHCINVWCMKRGRSTIGINVLRRIHRICHFPMHVLYVCCIIKMISVLSASNYRWNMIVYNTQIVIFRGLFTTGLIKTLLIIIIRRLKHVFIQYFLMLQV